MKEQIKGRQLEIVRYLIASGTPLPISYFIQKLNKSERSIRYDITTLRDILQIRGIDIKTKAKKGLYIPASQKQRCSDLLQEYDYVQESIFLDDDPAARNRALTLYFIIQKKTITANELADFFYVSRSTVLRMIQYFNECHRDMKISAKKNLGYCLNGDEFTIRKEASLLCFDLFKGSYTMEEWYLSMPSLLKQRASFQKLTDISEAIKKNNTLHNVWISNTSFIQLFSYCLVRYLRMELAEYATTQLLATQGYGYVEDLLQSLDGEAASFDCQENDWLLKVLRHHGIYVGAKEDGNSDLKIILEEILERLDQKQSISFQKEALCQDLYVHFQHYFSKHYLYQKAEDNPLINEIKTHYKTFYELAVTCAEVFVQHGYEALSENEITYLAIYLYKHAVVEQKIRKRVVVVCASGKGLSNLLATRIRNVFADIEIVEQVSPYQAGNLYKWGDIDFVISTIPLTDCLYPVVKISRILTTEDIQRIQEFIQYGRLMDAIPMSHPNIASLYGEQDPYQLHMEYDAQEAGLEYASVILSKLMLTLLEFTSELPKRYEMDQDALLGLIIHMSMAVPRWFQPASSDKDYEEIEDDYYKKKEQHQAVFELMERFFSLVEESLLVTIPVNERAAFLLYIIH